MLILCSERTKSIVIFELRASFTNFSKVYDNIPNSESNSCAIYLSLGISKVNLGGHRMKVTSIDIDLSPQIASTLIFVSLQYTISVTISV